MNQINATKGEVKLRREAIAGIEDEISRIIIQNRGLLSEEQKLRVCDLEHELAKLNGEGNG